MCTHYITSPLLLSCFPFDSHHADSYLVYEPETLTEVTIRRVYSKSVDQRREAEGSKRAFLGGTKHGVTEAPRKPNRSPRTECSPDSEPQERKILKGKGKHRKSQSFLRQTNIIRLAVNVNTCVRFQEVTLGGPARATRDREKYGGNRTSCRRISHSLEGSVCLFYWILMENLTWSPDPNDIYGNGIGMGWVET